MTLIKDVMTKNVHKVELETTLKETADKMRAMDVGAMPVMKDDKVVGILTDRDITIRGVADGKNPDTTRVENIMTKGVTCAYEDETIDELARTMKNEKIRRAVVLDRKDNITGMVSIGDLARSQADIQKSADILREVSRSR